MTSSDSPFSLLAEQDNLRAALEWSLQFEPETALRLCAGLWRHWEARGQFAEGRRWLSEALRLNPDAPPALRARALVGSGKLAWFAGDFTRAGAHLEEALLAARAAPDPDTLAAALLFLGNLANYRADFARAEPLLREGLEMQRRARNPEGIATALLHLSHAVINRHDLAGAGELIAESLALTRARGDSGALVITLYYAGEVALLQGDWNRAGRIFNEGLAIARRSDDRVGIAYVLFGLAWLARENGAPDPAHFAQSRDYLREAARVIRDNGHGWAVPFMLEGFGYLAAAQGECERAAQLLGASEVLREAMPLPLAPSYHAIHERHHAQICQGLDEAALKRAWGEGRALSPDEATALALES